MRLHGLLPTSSKNSRRGPKPPTQRFHLGYTQFLRRAPTFVLPPLQSKPATKNIPRQTRREGSRRLGQTAQEFAFRQVMNYFRQNQAEMQRVIETEVDVSVEKPHYILTGKVELLMGGDGRLELLDFKTP